MMWQLNVSGKLGRRRNKKYVWGGHIIGRVTVLLNMVELTEMNQVFGENNKCNFGQFCI